MPLRTPNILMTFASDTRPQFHANWVQHQLLWLKWISKRMKPKATEQEEGKRVRVLRLPEFIAALTVKLLILKALILRMLLALKYRGMLLVG